MQTFTERLLCVKSCFGGWGSVCPSAAYYRIFQTVRRTPQIWKETGGCVLESKCRLPGLPQVSALKDAIKYFATFFASKFFFPIFLL